MKNTYVLSSTTSKKLSSTLLVTLLFLNTGSIFAKERNPFEAPKNSRFYNQNDVILVVKIWFFWSFKWVAFQI